MTITRGDIEAWYPLQRDTRDIIGANDGTNNGASLITDSAFDRLVGSYNFDGQDDYISIPTLDVSGSFALSLWVNMNDSSSQQTLIAPKADLDCQIDIENGEVRFNGFDGNDFTGPSATLPGTNQWVHILGAYDDANTEMKLYVDGSLQDTVNQAVNAKSSSSRYGTNPNGFNPVDGSISQGIIFNSDVSSNVSTLFNSGNGVTARGLFPLTDDLKGYYPFDGDVTDATGNGNDGTNNGVTFTQGRIGQAGDYDGGDTVDVTSISIPNGSSFSISMWIKVSSFSGSDERIFYMDGNSGVVEYGTTNFANDFGIKYGSTKAFSSAAKSKVEDGNWHHVVGVYDASTTTLKHYIDGELQDSASGTISDDFSAKKEFGDTDSNNYNDLIDEGAVLTRALTDGEIRRLYSYGAGLRYEDLDKEHPLNEKTAAAYNFEGDATDARNSTYDATAINSPTFTSALINKGVDTNGTDQYIDIPTSLTQNPMTLSLWVKTTATGGISHTDDPNETFNNDFYLTPSKLQIADTDKITGLGLDDGNWHHAVIVINGSNSELFIDNVSQGTFSDDGVFSNGSSKNFTLAVQNDSSNNGLVSYFDALFDSVLISKTTVATTEINQLYNAGGGRQFPYTFNAPGKVFRTSNGVKQTVPTGVLDTK